MPAEPAIRAANLDDLLRAISLDERCEIVAGELVHKAAGDERHGDAQAELTTRVRSTYNRRSGGDQPGGGWWIRVEVDIAFGADVYRPDLSGWRRDRVPTMPTEWPCPIAPDWVGEVLSASTASRDLGVKMRGYHRAGVGHYWVVDRTHNVLLVYERNERAFELVQSAGIGERVHAVPFEAAEIDVGRLFGVETDPE